MNLRRPSVLCLELRERPQFSLASLVSGGDGVGFDVVWVALAPHLGREVELEAGDLAVFEAVPPAGSTACASLMGQFGNSRIQRLVDAGLLIGDHEGHRELLARDERLGASGWWPPAAVAHSFGRWRGVDVAAEEAREGKRTVARLVEVNGLPPAESLELSAHDRWHRLPSPARSAFDELLARRSTCRNFDRGFELPIADLATMLHRVFGAQASLSLAPGATMLKKNSPSGGGLHPTEAYLLVQRVDGLSPGLYHYQCVEHALEPMRDLESVAAAMLAHELVAGQPWFADAPVLVLMAARFARTFWKYRNHAKAWKVIQLDAGHLSQNFYLSATDLGYGAFVTGAINDECAERAFELDGMADGAIAVCGFGKRASELKTTEFDPLGKAVR